MSPVQTLFDFTNSLVSDPQALSAFQADPTGVLNAAGLGDVTAADVHDVIPLVLDFAPAPVAEQFDRLADLAQADQLSPDAVTGALSGAVDQLRQFTGQFTAATTAVDSVQHTAAAAPKVLPTTDNVVNTVTTDLGVHPVVDSATAGLNSSVQQVAGTVDGLLGNLPVAGPLVTSGMTDLTNAVGGVAINEANGTLVGSAADAVTNHLLDSALATTANETLTHYLPPVGNAVVDLEHSLAGPLGTVNTALGSTPVHPPQPAEHHAAQPGVVVGDSAHAALPVTDPAAHLLPAGLGQVTAPVHSAALPAVQHTVQGVSGVVDHTVDHGLVGDTVHQVADTAHLNIGGDELAHPVAEPAHLLGAVTHDLPLGL